MVPLARYTLTAYERRFRRSLMVLVEHQYRLHVHLDWTTLDEWVEDPATLIQLAWQGDLLVGALVISPPLAGAAWIRLLAVHDSHEPSDVIPALWEVAKVRFTLKGVETVSILAVYPWVIDHLESLSFHQTERVVTLTRGEMPILPPKRTDLHIHLSDLAQLPDAIQIDHAAFEPVWRMPKDSLRLAIRGAIRFTLATLDGVAVGYQISMRHGGSGHLARLATLPSLQGTGIGGALLSDLLTEFQRRGITQITVNTQATNEQSIHLYQRYGFTITGPSHEVWVYAIT